MKPFMLEDRGPAPYDSITILLNGNKGRSSGKPADGHAWLSQFSSLLPKQWNEELQLWEYRSKRYPDQPNYYVADFERIGSDGKRRNESEVIMCNGMPWVKGDNNTKQCQGMYFIRKDVHVTYRYFHKYIQDAHEIDRAVNDLIESFFIKD
jgi:hypothetical protein